MYLRKWQNINAEMQNTMRTEYWDREAKVKKKDKEMRLCNSFARKKK